MTAWMPTAEPGRPGRLVRRSAWAVLAVVGAWLVVAFGGALFAPRGDPGRLTEIAVPLPSDLTTPLLTDVTADWGLAGWRNVGVGEFAGGVSIADLDRDGRLDLVVTGGDLNVYFNTGEGFVPAMGRVSGIGRTVSASLAADLDRDGWVDVVVGAERGDGVVVWGGAWAAARDLAQAETSPIPGGEPTTGFAASDLTGNGLLDLVRLGYGRARPVDDVVLEHRAPREFVTDPLPDSRRRSLAVEIADVDADGSLEIWVTRDVGWKSGGDSLYRRDSEGRWRDIAPEVGSALEIDGMGVSIGDLDLDGMLDAYLSDLGDNEVLVGDGGGFRLDASLGLARIRPPGAGEGVVSSSWGTGLADVNLDGILDVVVANGGFTGGSVANKISGTTVANSDSPALFLGLGDGTYADVWSSLGFDWPGVSRSVGLGDLDGDGDTDLVFVQRRGPLRVFRNDTRAPSITVVPAAGCVAHGSTVTVAGSKHTVMRVFAPHSFRGNHAAELIVGASGPFEITVRWSDGRLTDAGGDPAGGRIVVEVPCLPD